MFKSLDKVWENVSEDNEFCTDCKYSYNGDIMECSHINFRKNRSYYKKSKDSDRYPSCFIIRRSKYCNFFEPSFIKKLKEYVKYILHE